jgi:hypothetical protein
VQVPGQANGEAKSADELLYDKVPGEPVEMGYVTGLLQLQKQGMHTVVTRVFP